MILNFIIYFHNREFLKLFKTNENIHEQGIMHNLGLEWHIN